MTLSCYLVKHARRAAPVPHAKIFLRVIPHASAAIPALAFSGPSAAAVADATVAAIIAAVIVVDAPASLLAADAPVDVSNAAPAVPAAPGTIAVIRADAPGPRAARNSFPRCSRPAKTLS